MKESSLPYQLFMLILCAATLVMLVLEGVFRLDAEVEGILDYADTFVCAVFLFDFASKICPNPTSKRPMMRCGGRSLPSPPSATAIDFR